MIQQDNVGFDTLIRMSHNSGSDFSVSVIIVSYNSKSEIAVLIPLLIEIAEKLPIELIIVDNNSTDGSLDILTKYSDQLTLIKHDANYGFACAVNNAAKISKGSYLLLLNPDADIGSESLRMLVEYLDNHPEVGVVAPRINYFDGRIQPSRGSFPNLITTFAHIIAVKKWLPSDEWMQQFVGGVLGHIFRQYSPPGEEQAVDYTTGACVLIRNEIYKHLGGLDENFFLYYEEIDFGLRMSKLGFFWVFLNRATADHRVAASSGHAPLRPYAERYRSMLYYFYKHKPTWQFRLVYLAISLSAALRICLLPFTNRFRIDPETKKAEEKATLCSIFGFYQRIQNLKKLGSA